MSSETETEVVENPSESITEEEQPPVIEPTPIARNTRKQASMEKAQDEDNEKKTNKKVRRWNLVQEASEDEEESPKPSPKKPRKEYVRLKKLKPKVEEEDSDDVVDVTNKKLKKKVKEEKPEKKEKQEEQKEVKEQIVLPSLEQAALTQKPLDLVPPLAPPQTKQPLGFLEQQHIQVPVVIEQQILPQQPILQQQIPLQQQPLLQQKYNSPIASTPQQLQPTMYPMEMREIDQKRNDLVMGGVVFKFEKTHTYGEDDGPYDPLVGLYSNRQKIEMRRNDSAEYNKLKTHISKFVVERLQPYYDDHIIKSKDEFKQIARTITIRFTEDLFSHNETFTQEAEKKIAKCIAIKFDPNEY